MIAMIKERQFDGAIIFTSYHQSSLPAAYLCYLADIPLRLAASIDGPGSLLTTRHKHPERMMHEVERGLDLVNAIGLTTSALDLVLKVPIMARESVYEFLFVQNVDPHRPLLLIHPGCSMSARTYPYDMYSRVLDLVIERLGATVVVTGTKDEQALVEHVLDKVHEHNRRATIACAGTLPFPDFCALIEAADLMITNNTGPMHIAAAVKTPVVALFALTNPPEQWGPWLCPYNHECLRLVTPEMVADATTELLIETVPGVIDISGKYREVSGRLPPGLDDAHVSTLLHATSASTKTNNQVNGKKVLR